MSSSEKVATVTDANSLARSRSHAVRRKDGCGEAWEGSLNERPLLFKGAEERASTVVFEWQEGIGLPMPPRPG